jgi:hypothetical protein
VARFLAALSALVRLCSGVGGLMISVILIKYLAWCGITAQQLLPTQLSTSKAVENYPALQAINVGDNKASVC